MEIVSLSVDLLVEPLIVVRENLETEGFRDLIRDIREHGNEVPIIVRRVVLEGAPDWPPDSTAWNTPEGARWIRYRVVDGFRRWRAALEAGVREVKCEVRALDDAGEIALLMRVALHREDFTPLEEGKMFATMHEGLHLTYDGIARRVGKSAAYVTARLAVIRGPDEVRQALASGEINLSVALEIMKVTHEEDRAYVLHWARSQGASAATVAGWVRERLQSRAQQPDAPTPTTRVEEGAAPPVVMGVCGWHQGPYPLDGMIGFQVCRPCYGQLEVIRETLKRQAVAEGGGDSHGPGP